MFSSRAFAFVLLAFCLTASVVCAELHETVVVVRELDEVEIPAKRNGVIREMTIRRGARVEKKQPIAQLDAVDRELRLLVNEAELKQAIVKSQDVGNVESAKAAVSRAETEKRLLNELGGEAVFLERFRMQNSLVRTTAELRSAENQMQQDKLQVEVKRSQAALLKNDLKETTVLSPVNGVVRELKKHQGEWVEQGQAIMIVTRMDRLLAEGFLDSNEMPVHSVIGSSATVSFTIGNDEKFVMEGLVVERVAPKLELDGKFPVWVEFDNRIVAGTNGKRDWLLRPGMRATMSIELPDSKSKQMLDRTAQRESPATTP